MVPRATRFPFSIKASVVIIGILAFMTMMYVGRSIIVPIVFAMIIAIVLVPVVNFFVRLHVNRLFAIIFTLILTILLIAGFGLLIYSQASRFAESWPLLVDKFTLLLKETSEWASAYFDINPKKIDAWIHTTRGEVLNTSSAAIGKTIISVGNGLVVLFLVPVYVFLFLFYQPLLLEFIYRLFGRNNQNQVTEVVGQTRTVIQRYLVGLIIEVAIVAGLDTIALLIIGVEYAFLLGILAGLLNVIPYIGGLVAVALPMMIALATLSSGWSAIYVMAAYYVIQLIDNNYIVPKIVASKVKINALFSIIVVIAGNAMWGIPGMFLSIPLLAVVKLICDHIEPLKPWGYLLGDTMPSVLKIKPMINKVIPTLKRMARKKP